MPTDDHQNVPSDADEDSGIITSEEDEYIEIDEEAQDRRIELLSRTSLTAYQIACLKDIDITVIKEAWFTLSHLILEPDSMIAVMGCGDGELAYTVSDMRVGLFQDEATA